MSGPQFMPFYVGDYLRDTQHLTAEQHGAYLLLLMACWTLGALPDNERELARIAKLSIIKWRRFLSNFENFFAKNSDGLWHQKRIDRERQHIDAVKAVRSKAGILSAAKRQQTANKSSTRARVPKPDLEPEPDFSPPLIPPSRAKGGGRGRRLHVSSPRSVQIEGFAHALAQRNRDC